MNILVVGRGKGSWEMRGVQLGAALGARVTSEPIEDDWRWCDLAILIKRDALRWAATAHAHHVPIAWDCLDFWQQPGENHLSEGAAVRLLLATRTRIRPALSIGATEAMAYDVGGVYLPHHGRIGLEPTPAREHVRIVGYDGNGCYLAEWAPAIQAECRRRRWEFVINPADLSKCDLLVALRGGPWDGFPCRRWKSNVKYSNSILSGRPIIAQRTAAFDETQPDGSVVETPADLSAAFDFWEPYERRDLVLRTSERRYHEFELNTIAQRYRQILEEVARPVETGRAVLRHSTSLRFRP